MTPPLSPAAHSRTDATNPPCVYPNLPKHTPAERLRAYACSFHDQWAAPLTIAIALTQLLFLLGPCALAAALLACVLLALQEKAGNAEAALRARARRRAEARAGLLADVLRHPRATKLAGCEFAPLPALPSLPSDYPGPTQCLSPMNDT